MKVGSRATAFCSTATCKPSRCYQPPGAQPCEQRRRGGYRCRSRDGLRARRRDGLLDDGRALDDRRRLLLLLLLLLLLRHWDRNRHRDHSRRGRWLHRGWLGLHRGWLGLAGGGPREVSVLGARRLGVLLAGLRGLGVLGAPRRRVPNRGLGQLSAFLQVGLGVHGACGRRLRASLPGVDASTTWCPEVRGDAP